MLTRPSLRILLEACRDGGLRDGALRWSTSWRNHEVRLRRARRQDMVPHRDRGRGRRRIGDMHHAVEKYFRKEHERAAQSFRPLSKVNFEQEIGLKAHVQREMPLFLTLRDDDGTPLATAMLPPGGRDDRSFRPIIVGAVERRPLCRRGRCDSRARRAFRHDAGAHALLPLSPRLASPILSRH